MEVLDLRAATLAVAFCAIAVAPAPTAADAPTFQRRYAAGEVTHLDLRARVGRMLVEATDKPEVSIEIVLDSRDRSRVGSCRASARLEDALRGGRMTVSVRQHGRQQCAEQWLVKVPAGIGLTLNVDVGDIVVDGGDAPSPRAIDAASRVGDVSVSASTDYRNLIARARVGRVSLDLDGAVVRPTALGPAQSVEINGRGRLDVRLTSGVGSIRANLKRGRRPE